MTHTPQNHPRNGNSKPLTHAERGRLGGLATLAKHGINHYKTIGEIGAMVFHERYRLEPYGFNDFAIIDRATNRTINTLSGNFRKGQNQ